MDLKEIVNRPNETPIEEQEACLVIKEYIKVRKGGEVQPMIETRQGKFNAIREVNLMRQMLNYAIGWFRQNPNAL